MSDSSNSNRVLKDPVEGADPNRSPLQYTPRRSFVWLSPLLVGLTFLLILVQFLGLRPKNLELGTPDTEPDSLLDPQSLTLTSPGSQHPILSSKLPKHKVPEYSIEQFQFTAVQKDQKIWRILADSSSTYQKENLTHASQVTVYIYPDNPTMQGDGMTPGTLDVRPDIITANEALYQTNNDTLSQEIEFFGNVEISTADGFLLRSPYFVYRPYQRKVQVPTDQEIEGHGKQARRKGEIGEIDFRSFGLDVHLGQAQIRLLRNPVVTLTSTSEPSRPGSNATTVIESHFARIDGKERVAYFDVKDTPTSSIEHVRITQKRIYARSKSATLKLNPPGKDFEYLTLQDEVLIKKRSEKRRSQAALEPLRYATGGKAEFLAYSNTIRLSEYPQIYEDENTMTGETITISNDFDTVEVEHSNAFATDSLGVTSP